MSLGNRRNLMVNSKGYDVTTINKPKSKEVRTPQHSCVDPYLTSNTITISSIEKIYRE